MIGKLSGTVDTLQDDSVILDVGGVGYLVHCPSSTLSRLGSNPFKFPSKNRNVLRSFL